MAKSRFDPSTSANRTGDARSALERTFREEASRLTASLVRLLGDFDLAEEMVSEAVVEAMRHWPDEGIPERPGAWLMTTARRKGLDRVRRDSRYKAKLAVLAALPETASREPDERLRLIFTCCHPALDPGAQIAVTLKTVAGLTTTEIARAFLVPEPTLAKRLTRAKRKIAAGGIPYRTPQPEELPARLDQVLRVIYLIFNEGYFTTAGDRSVRAELAHDAAWLASLLHRWLPDEPEPIGLLALIRLHLARWDARFDHEGNMVLLADQDRSVWDKGQIASAVRLIERAARTGRVGPYQIEAAIAAVHCEAPSWDSTDWEQLLALYTLLQQVDGSPVVRLNRAIVRAEVVGPRAALADVDALHEALSGYHLFHATRAALLVRLGRTQEAARANEAALQLAANRAERTLLEHRVTVPGEVRSLRDQAPSVEGDR